MTEQFKCPPGDTALTSDVAVKSEVVDEAPQGIATEIPAPTKRLSINQLEELLNRDDEALIEIMPNGEIREFSEEEQAKVRSTRKPLTMRENLGGEYAA